MNLRILFFILYLCALLVSFAFGQIEQVIQTVTPEGGKIELEICGYVEFPEGYLNEDTEVTFSCSDKEATYYPENFNVGELFTPIGLNTVVTIPASAIDPNVTLEDKDVVLRVRVPPTIMYERTSLAEIRYRTDDGTELFGIDQYSADSPVEIGIASSQIVHIRLSELAILVDNYDTQTITISIVPVAPKDLINAGPPSR